MNTSKRELRVAKAIDSVQNTDGLIVLSTGVILKTKRVPNMLFAELMKRHTRPLPPRILDRDRGREIENPNDPEYVARLEAWQSELTLDMTDAMIGMGTAIYSLPKGFPTVDSEEWLEPLRVLNFDPGDNKVARYLLWVKYVAGPSDEDVNKLLTGVGSASGVTEVAVADALDQFRDSAE